MESIVTGRALRALIAVTVLDRRKPEPCETMKTQRLLLVALLGLVTAAPLAAADQSPDRGPHPRLKAMLRRHLFRKADTDGDRRLSEAERSAARTKFEERRSTIVARHDKDGDGTLSESEKAAARDQVRTRLQNAKATHDTDGDGTLNPTERQAARDAFRQRQAQ
jgi:hypothetical protein